MWKVSLKCLETRTWVLTYHKEHSKESTRCKTKMQVTLYFESQWVYREFYLHHILQNLVYLFKLRNISIYNLNYNIIVLLFDNDKYSIFQSSEKKNWCHLEVWCFQPKAEQSKNSPCKLTSPWVARKFQETDPFIESVSFPQCCDVH